jgi:hypothetical protein
MAALLKVAPPQQILSHIKLSAKDRLAIERQNAVRLLPRLNG